MKKQLYWFITALFAFNVGGYISYQMYFWNGGIPALSCGFLVFCWTFALSYCLLRATNRIELWGVDVKAYLKEWWLVLLIAISSFNLIVVIYPYTDMYKSEQAFQRQQAINYLRENYFESRFPDIKQRIMEDFHLTDNDINPIKLIERAEQEWEHNDK